MSDKDIIGIFDIENTSVSHITRDFLARAGKSGRTEYVSYEMPKAYILCEDRIYITAVSPLTLKKRAEEAADNISANDK